jgi:lipopolysaccharide export system permease protein
MKFTLYRYLLKELFTPFFLGLIGFTFILLTGRILQLTELFVNKGISSNHLLKLLYFLLPSFLVLTIPMATLLAVLLAFNRLASDNEVTALKASGISLYQMAPPALTLALFATLLTSGLSLYFLPSANHGSRTLLYEMASTIAKIGVKERVFNDHFEGLVLYVDQVNSSGSEWRGVFISDARNPAEVNTIIAREGQILPDPRRLMVTLRLKDGAIHKLGHREAYQKVGFSTYDLRLDLKAGWRAKQSEEKHPADMTLSELRRAILDLRSKNFGTKIQWVKIHEKFSIPFACLVFGIIGIPLGIQSRASRAAKSIGFAWAIGVLLVYYLLTNLGTSLAERGVVHMEAGMWAANAIFLFLGIYLLVKAANESPVFFLVALDKILEKVHKKIGSRWRAQA